MNNTESQSDGGSPTQNNQKIITKNIPKRIKNILQKYFVQHYLKRLFVPRKKLTIPSMPANRAKIKYIKTGKAIKQYPKKSEYKKSIVSIIFNYILLLNILLKLQTQSPNQ